MVNSRLAPGARFSDASRQVFTFPRRENTAPHRSRLSFLSLSSSTRGMRADLPADWIRARGLYVIFLASLQRLTGTVARRNTSKSAEAITTFLPSDEGSSNPPSARDFPLVTRSLYPIVPLTGPSIYSLAHASVPSLVRTKVT
jgi:hypothetical protein